MMHVLALVFLAAQLTRAGLGGSPTLFTAFSDAEVVAFVRPDYAHARIRDIVEVDATALLATPRSGRYLGGQNVYRTECISYVPCTTVLPIKGSPPVLFWLATYATSDRDRQLPSSKSELAFIRGPANGRLRLEWLSQHTTIGVPPNTYTRSHLVFDTTILTTPTSVPDETEPFRKLVAILGDELVSADASDRRAALDTLAWVGAADEVVHRSPHPEEDSYPHFFSVRVAPALQRLIDAGLAERGHSPSVAINSDALLACQVMLENWQ